MSRVPYAEKRAVKRASQGQRKYQCRQKRAERTTLNARSDEPCVQRHQQRLARRSEVKARGYEIIDVRDQPCKRVPDLAFICDPGAGHVR